jgi:hypothetical protein
MAPIREETLAVGRAIASTKQIMFDKRQSWVNDCFADRAYMVRSDLLFCFIFNSENSSPNQRFSW